MSSRIDVDALYEFEGYSKLWYMAHGHVDKQGFLDEIKREYEEEYPIEKVQYAYAHNRPVGKDYPGEWIVDLAKKSGRGNYPITYIDLEAPL